MEKGVVRVRQEGIEGLQEQIFELVKKNGEEMSRIFVSSSIISEPQDLILEYGEMDLQSRSGRNPDFERAIIVEATAYCPGTPGSGCPVDERGASLCTGFHNDGYTSTGAKATAGRGTRENPHIIAVDPQYIPLKTMVYLNGYGFARAEDTGSAIKGLAIDLLLIGMPKRWLSEGERSRYIFWTGNPGVTDVSSAGSPALFYLTKKQYDKLVMSESQPHRFYF